jgi:hypothetical protein
MAAGFVHEMLDLISLGRVYRHIHKRKDEHAQRAPGLRHREVGHDWYQSYGKRWNFDVPFPPSLMEEMENVRKWFGPDAAEERMASDGHDLLDRTWDGLSKPERLYWEGFFAWLLYRPDLLESWAGVDVLHGHVCRTIGGKVVWEDSPETVGEYSGLRRRVSKNHKHRLRVVLGRNGN